MFYSNKIYHLHEMFELFLLFLKVKNKNTKKTTYIQNKDIIYSFDLDL